MLKIQLNLPLRSESPQGWVETVNNDLDSFLLDHAACERKASALAMSLVVRFSDRKALIEPMICVAKEELAHFHEVYRILSKRGLTMGADEKDPYVQKLRKVIRHGREEHFLDSLLVSGVIEARGCERFCRLGLELADLELRPYYERLGKEEAGHFTVFTKVAKQYFSNDLVQSRLDEILDIESEVMHSVPLRAAVH